MNAPRIPRHTRDFLPTRPAVSAPRPPHTLRTNDRTADARVASLEAARRLRDTERWPSTMFVGEAPSHYKPACPPCTGNCNQGRACAERVGYRLGALVGLVCSALALGILAFVAVALIGIAVDAVLHWATVAGEWFMDATGVTQ